jgi:predicted nucleotidyltransferase
VEDTLKERIVAVLERHPEVVGAYLFGSRGRGEEADGSDVDVAVLFDDPTDLEHTIALEDEIERSVGLSVDLVDVARAGPYLALDAVRGERVFERDGRRLDELDLYVLRRAGDLAHFERERRRALLAVGAS